MLQTGKKEHTILHFQFKSELYFLNLSPFFFFFSLPPSLIAFIPLLCLHPFFPGRGCGAAHHRFLFLYSDAMYRSPTFLCFCTRVCFYIFLYLFLSTPPERCSFIPQAEERVIIFICIFSCFNFCCFLLFFCFFCCAALSQPPLCVRV